MTPDEVLSEAERIFTAGDVMGAERMVGRVWADTTNAPPAVLHLLGAIHYRTRDFVGAERFLRRAIKASPRDSRHHAALGELYAAAGHFGHACDSFAQALKLEPKLPSVREAFARTSFHAGRFADTEKAARAMLAEAPTVAAWDMLSSALREQGKYKEAVAAAEEGLKIDPHNTKALHSRAAAWTYLGRDTEALDLFETLTVRGVQSHALSYFRARALMNLKRHHEAAGLLAHALRRWPGNERLRAAYAEVLKKAKPN